MMEMPSNTYSPIFTKLRAKVRTVPSSRAKLLLFSSRPLMTRAAEGAQLPFSTMATVRLQKPRAVRCSMNSRINGKMSLL